MTRFCFCLVALSLLSLAGGCEDLGITDRPFACRGDGDCSGDRVCRPSSTGEFECVEPDEEPCEGDAFLLCGERCIDITSDANHCGGCSLACPGDQTCSDSQCALEGCGVSVEEAGEPQPPAEPATLSNPIGTCINGTLCVDLMTDPEHCGGCEQSCPPTQECLGGVCSQLCDHLGLNSCEGECVDVSTDRDHCGSCGRFCDRDEVCIEGQCLCGAQSSGDGDVCLESQSCCATKKGPGAEFYCANLSGDAENCGQCGFSCPSPNVELNSPGLICDLGACVCVVDGSGIDSCKDNEVCCTSGCAVIDSDVNNCGACGNVCGDGEACIAGLCACGAKTGGPSLSACVSEIEECCSGRCDVQGSCERCGPSGVLCANGQECCDDVCVSVLSDPNNCGLCGVTCSATERCEPAFEATAPAECVDESPNPVLPCLEIEVECETAPGSGIFNCIDPASSNEFCGAASPDLGSPFTTGLCLSAVPTDPNYMGEACDVIGGEVCEFNPLYDPGAPYDAPIGICTPAP